VSRPDATMPLRRKLGRLSKGELIRLHRQGGGLMRIADYWGWTHEELIEACVEDQEGSVVIHEEPTGGPL